MPYWLSIVDVVFVGVVLLFAWGLPKGFAGQIAHILTLVVMGGFLFFAYPAIFNYLGRVFRSVDKTYLMWLILSLVFVLAILLFLGSSKLLAKLLKAQVSDASDSGWGMVLGLVRGALFALFAMVFLVLLEPSGRFYGRFTAKSYVGKMVCYEMVPRIQPHLSRSALENKMKAFKAKLMEQEEAGVLE